MYTILIVEDDPTLAQLLTQTLSRWGFRAPVADDLEHVMDAFERERPHLVLMDVSLPYYNGFTWCAEIRKRSRAPVLFLSSNSEAMSVVMAVSMGGDDYVTKPFSVDVLVAKINALLRRAYDYAGDAPQLEARGARFSAADGTLRAGGTTIELTRNEQRILATLLSHKGAIVSREEIMTRLWDGDSFVDDNTLTVNINRLRKKLDEAGLHDFITTKKGQGYVIEDD